nr:hypothetical protein CFP56_46261 [Quercus suber]
MSETKWDKVQAGQGPQSRMASMQTLESPSKQTLLHLSPTTASAAPEGEVAASVLSLITPGGGGVQEGAGSKGLGGLGGEKVSENSRDLNRMLWMAR